MVDERAARRSTFADGTGVRMANGQVWVLPGRLADADDPEYDACLLAVVEAEDRTELLRAELALTILLLSRNYHLKPGDFQDLLGFAPDDPALGEMQDAVHEVAIEHAQRFYVGVVARVEEPRVTRWSLPALGRRLWFRSLRTP